MHEQELPHDHGEHLEWFAEKLADVAGFSLAADAFKQLSDSTRIRIFWLLCHCEECVINISALMDMTSPAVSHHLKQLRSAQLITSRREGKEVYYRAADTEQAKALHHMIEKMLRLTCPSEEQTDEA